MSISNKDILETFQKGEVVEKDGQILSKELAKIYESNKKSAEYINKK